MTIERTPLTAACIAIGSELLGTQRIDSNSLRITEELHRFGYEVVEKRVVGDDVNRLACAIGELLERVQVVVVTGGLGPTADDITREAVARATGRRLERDEETAVWLRERYRLAGRRMPDICLKMADVVEGSTPLKNPRGAAPGIQLEIDGRLLMVFPGVPFEMEEMLERDLVPVLAARGCRATRSNRTLLLGGVGESLIEERVSHLYDRFGRANVTILASYGVLRLILTAEGIDASPADDLDVMEAAFREVLGDDVVAADVSGLAEAVLGDLGARSETLATAESCTGGLIAAQLTDIPGSSAVYLGGVVAYSNEVKERQLAVPHQLLLDHGAVSEPVARAMAEGARHVVKTTWGVGVTGIAGPGGGSEDKPVGLVHWAVAGPEGTEAFHRVLHGSRSIIREWSANMVLDSLRRRMLV